MKIRVLISAFVFLFAAAGSASALDTQPATITGKVVLVKSTTSQILVAYRKPGALIETISTFRADGQTSFKNVSNLAELKINDPVSVSYVESESGNYAAQVIEKQPPAAPETLPEPTAQS